MGLLPSLKLLTHCTSIKALNSYMLSNFVHPAFLLVWCTQKAMELICDSSTPLERQTTIEVTLGHHIKYSLLLLRA